MGESEENVRKLFIDAEQEVRRILGGVDRVIGGVGGVEGLVGRKGLVGW